MLKTSGIRVWPLDGHAFMACQKQRQDARLHLHGSMGAAQPPVSLDTGFCTASTHRVSAAMLSVVAVCICLIILRSSGELLHSPASLARSSFQPTAERSLNYWPGCFQSEEAMHNEDTQMVPPLMV